MTIKQHTREAIELVQTRVGESVRAIWPSGLGEAAAKYIQDGLTVGGVQLRVDAAASVLEKAGKLDRQNMSVEDQAALTAVQLAWYFTRNAVMFDKDFEALLLQGAEGDDDTIISRRVFERLIGQPLALPMVIDADPSEIEKGKPVIVMVSLVGAYEDTEGALQVISQTFAKDSELFHIGCRMTYFAKNEQIVRLGDCRRRSTVMLKGSYPGMFSEEAKIILPFVMYALSDMREALEWRSARYLPVPKKVKKGMKLFPPERMHTVELGVEIGESIREYDSEVRETDGIRTVRPHIRRGHWHSYWYGPRNAETRDCRLLWVAPTFVKSHDPAKG